MRKVSQSITSKAVILSLGYQLPANRQPIYATLLIVGLLFLFTLTPTATKAQYCYSFHARGLHGELGGKTHTYNTILIAEDATFSSEGGLIGQDAVIMYPDFHVKAGVNFSASVTACRSTKPYLNIPKENAVLDNGCVGNTELREWYFEWNEVQGATKYHILVTIPGAKPVIDLFTTDNHITSRRYSYIPNSNRENWEASVRAEVGGKWTPWYGGDGDQPLSFSVEPVNTDCAPILTSPLPGAILDNGCNGTIDTMHWYFEWTPVAAATKYQLIIEHPNIGFATFNKTVTTNHWTFKEPDRISVNYTNWTAKVRAYIADSWTAYHGSSLDETEMLFNVEPKNTDCSNLVNDNATSRTIKNNNSIAPINFQVYPNPFQQESSITYQLKENAVIQLGIYNLTGQVVDILVPQQKQSAGDYTIPFLVKQATPPGMYLAVLQAGKQKFFKKIILLE